MEIDLRLGDCLEVMRSLPDASVDAVVTDPPAGISFMGKAWDSQRTRGRFVDFLVPRLAEARRVSRPGSYMLCWALPRTSHWTGLAIEEAGWTIRDRISHLFGTGFPKSKACLKPACEDWWLAWNPAPKVTPLNIDECRIPGDEDGSRNRPPSVLGSTTTYAQDEWTRTTVVQRRDTTGYGRWPANVTHDGSDEVLEAFAAFGDRPAGGWPARRKGIGYDGDRPRNRSGTTGDRKDGDSGSAARFFYAAKASKADRDEGLDGMPARLVQSVAMGDKRHGTLPYTNEPREMRPVARRNHHPTVKSTPLMRWLCRLITTPGGMILDPFMGSGSTGKAAAAEGFGFIGIERDPSYFEIASRRLAAAGAGAATQIIPTEAIR